MGAPQLFALLVFAAAGGALIFAGMGQRTTAPANDPEAYLRSLDDDVAETDEFEQLLAEPFLGRVLRPLGSKALGSIASVLPTNYRDQIRHKPVIAGLAGQYR